MKEENGENLKHCGHCQVLNGSNYTDPPHPTLSPPISVQLPPPHLFTPLTLFPLSLCTSLALSLSLYLLSRSQCSPATGELKECCGPTRLHNRLLIPLSTKNKRTCITTGGLRKSKKSCNNETRIPWREYEKRYCLKQLLYSRFHKERVLFQQSAVDQGEPSMVREKEICSLGNCFFSFSFSLVCVLGSR